MRLPILAALAYGVLFLLNAAWGNAVTLFIQSLIGAVLFIALAVMVCTLDEEAAQEREKMQKEIDELRKAIDKL